VVIVVVSSEQKLPSVLWCCRMGERRASDL